LPIVAWDQNKKLPGLGGVYNAVNLNVYTYSGGNPIKFIDPNGEAKIVIDPGHGDTWNKWLDPGATGFGGKPPHEKDLALKLAQAIGQGLEKLGHSIVYTRTGDITEKQIRFEWRAKIAEKEKAEFFVSVHLNSMDEKLNYFIVAYQDPRGKIIAENMATAIRSQKGFSKSIAEKHSYTVLRLLSIPGILIEAGNIKNPQTADIIKDPAFIDALVQAIDKSIKELDKFQDKPKE